MSTNNAVNSKKVLHLPKNLIELKETFNNYYIQKYPGRRLTWAHSAERCLVTAYFCKGKKELEVSLFQTVVLLCFNNAFTTDCSSSSSTSSSSSSSSSSDIKLSLHDISERTGIEDGELRRVLQSLACGILSTRVLTKTPKSKDINDNDTFIVNNDFTNKMFRIKINSIQLRENKEDNEETYEQIFRDRQYIVDANIVRIMKTRKRLKHNELLDEVITQLRFHAQPSDIKKRIAHMIERDYLERDENDSNYYLYT